MEQFSSDQKQQSFAAKLKKIGFGLKGCIKPYFKFHIYIAFLTSIAHIMPAATNTPTDLDEVKIADNLDEYFNYLSTQTIDDQSDVHLVVPIQMALQQSGYDIGHCGVDGDPGNDFFMAVRQFQEDKDIPTSGVAYPETIQKLADTVLANKESNEYLEDHLIKPYKTYGMNNFMGSLDDTFAWHSGTSLLARPDIMIHGGISGLLTNRLGINAAEQAFPGCTGNHQRDGFRHSNAVVRIANFPTSNPEWGVTVADIRERGGSNPLPIKLMDMYNHRIAADIATEMEDHGFGLSDPNKFLVTAINDGKFLTYPLPLVPKNPIS